MSEVPGKTAPEGGALAELEALLGYQFQDRSLLLRALTHRSFVNEQESQKFRHNESMEFLGDAVLGFLISAKIFEHFPDSNEGELSKIKAYLVSAANLFRLAERIRLGEFLLLSRGEEKTGGRNKRAILVDAYEALLGAIYLDGGVEAAAGFLERQTWNLFDSLDLHQLTYGDFKSALQEQLHDMGKPEPIYQVVDEIGPDHRKMFVVEVLVGDEVVARSSGRTKKEAQQEAARMALQELKDVGPGDENQTTSKGEPR
jgi:ribonuclease-3